MKILITGDLGFIGSHTKATLEDIGHEVIGADKKSDMDVAEGKFFEYAALEKPDLIIHIAGSCSTLAGLENPLQDFKDNVMTTMNVLRVCKSFDIPLIYLSSCKANPNPKGIRTPYGLSKFASEEYIKEFAKAYGFDYIINRCGTIYGPGQSGSPESGWIAWFVKCALEGRALTINGDGEHRRDILYVTDLVQLLIDQVEEFDEYKNESYDVGGGEENAITLNQAVKYLGIKRTHHGIERYGDTKVFVSNNEKVSSVKNWRPSIDWKKGLDMTVKYYER